VRGSFRGEPPKHAPVRHYYPRRRFVYTQAGTSLILDVAERLIVQADRPIDIVLTGLSPGEKVHEVLLGSEERDGRPFHPLILRVPVPSLDPAEVQDLDPTPSRGR
jgi:FlaA1/EpsC-like NDP-sugar epimerase